MTKDSDFEQLPVAPRSTPVINSIARYSQRNDTIGSTLVARRAGM